MPLTSIDGISIGFEGSGGSNLTTGMMTHPFKWYFYENMVTHLTGGINRQVFLPNRE
jgi:hypothetical protein